MLRSSFSNREYVEGSVVPWSPARGYRNATSVSSTSPPPVPRGDRGQSSITGGRRSLGKSEDDRGLRWRFVVPFAPTRWRDHLLYERVSLSASRNASVHSGLRRCARYCKSKSPITGGITKLYRALFMIFILNKIILITIEKNMTASLFCGKTIGMASVRIDRSFHSLIIGFEQLSYFNLLSLIWFSTRFRNRDFP